MFKQDGGCRRKRLGKLLAQDTMVVAFNEKVSQRDPASYVKSENSEQLCHPASVPHTSKRLHYNMVLGENLNILWELH